MAHIALHAAAYALDPEFHKHQHLDGEEVMLGFDTMLRKLLPDAAQCARAQLQYTDYLHKQGVFTDPVMWTTAREVPAWKWWMAFAR